MGFKEQFSSIDFIRELIYLHISVYLKHLITVAYNYLSIQVRLLRLDVPETLPIAPIVV
jgi:hypothetical protein